MIDPEFYDLELYAIYKAIGEYFGDEGWKIVWRAGEIMFSEIEGKTGLWEKDAAGMLNRVAQYLRSAGYAEVIEFEDIGNGELAFRMRNVAASGSSSKLLKAGLVPPHTSTSIFFAALKKLGLKAEMIGEPQLFPDGSGMEKWRLSKL